MPCHFLRRPCHLISCYIHSLSLYCRLDGEFIKGKRKEKKLPLARLPRRSYLEHVEATPPIVSWRTNNIYKPGLLLVAGVIWERASQYKALCIMYVLESFISTFRSDIQVRQQRPFRHASTLLWWSFSFFVFFRLHVRYNWAEQTAVYSDYTGMWRFFPSIWEISLEIVLTFDCFTNFCHERINNDQLAALLSRAGFHILGTISCQTRNCTFKFFKKNNLSLKVSEKKKLLSQDIHFTLHLSILLWRGKTWSVCIIYFTQTWKHKFTLPSFARSSVARIHKTRRI